MWTCAYVHTYVMCLLCTLLHVRSTLNVCTSVHMYVHSMYMRVRRVYCVVVSVCCVIVRVCLYVLHR